MPIPRNPTTITEIVHMEIDGEVTSSIGKCRIFVMSPTEGIIIRDGRPVIKDGDRWLYRVRRVKKKR